MIVRRSSDADSGSLDLLLDTMCNAFGGIIFISFVLILLPSGKENTPAKKTVDPRLPALRRQLDELTFQQKRKERMLAAFQANIGVLDFSGEDERNREIENVLAKRDSMERRLLAMERSQREALDALEEQQGEVTELKSIRLDIERELRKTRELADKSDQRTTRLPKLRNVTKANYFVVLFQGRIYLPFPPLSTELGVTPNETDFVVRLTDQGMAFRPRPEAGMAVEEWLTSPQGVLDLLGKLPSTRHVANICVAPDSVGHFNLIRNAFTTRAYDYNWSPLAGDGILVLVRTSRGADAQ
jgi:hypothetical protein